MDGSAIKSGCWTLIVTTGLMLAVYAVFIGIYSTFQFKDYCIKCDQLLEPKGNYCPNCGTPTDTTNVYNYWNRPRE